MYRLLLDVKYRGQIMLIDKVPVVTGSDDNQRNISR